MSVYKLRTANKIGVAAPAMAPMTEEYKMNTMTMQQPVVQDPRYGGQQMA
jgi:hypothetical protein